MKKILLMLALAIAMVSCKEQPSRPGKEPKQKNWYVEVNFLDKTTDTIVVQSYNQPDFRVNNGVGYVDLGDSSYPAACYVKTMKIIYYEEAKN